MSNKDYSIPEGLFIEILAQYFSYDEDVIDRLLANPNRHLKQGIGRIKDLRFEIYTNDHNPPHFHVISKNRKVDAKFLIENGEYISGTITSKDLKAVKAFFNDAKTRSIMEAVWEKRNP